MWQETTWPLHWFGNIAARHRPLNYYAKELNSVEGNTTFYHLPAPDLVERWGNDVPAAFRFTFKFNQRITHEYQLRHVEALVKQQLTLLAPLEEKLGLYLIQLPASFGPDDLPALEQLLKILPDTFQYAVEMRHPAFFAKQECERQFNQLLIRYGVNRIIMDTRALFTGPCDSALTADVRMKKPRVPVNVIATGQHPVLRFVGGNDENVNRQCLQPWVKKCHQWRLEGRNPYLFFHRPDNKDAPWLAQLYLKMYNAAYPQAALPLLHFAASQQEALF
ncbi:DUF72 domain-containing protein [Alteromonas pelagimontana]|uniref:DUF72 domain-containing protein n=1 Tax=Alteromonas pelagimontana TaxID=1858656 RepID=A0A6M4MHP6_9ALTE|nr:DUF72 domain-containing protein [Alteromonas pelagimontana]